MAFIFWLQSLWLIDFNEIYWLKGLEPKTKTTRTFLNVVIWRKGISMVQYSLMYNVATYTILIFPLLIMLRTSRIIYHVLDLTSITKWILSTLVGYAICINILTCKWVPYSKHMPKPNFWFKMPVKCGCYQSVSIFVQVS